MALAFAVAGTIAACSASPVVAPSPTSTVVAPRPTTTIRVGATVVSFGADAADAGSRCVPEQVATRVQRFLAAFSTGDTVTFAEFVSSSLIFSEPNPPPRGFFVSSGPQALMDYVTERHAKHEIRELITIDLSYGSQGDQDRVDFGLKLSRTADDLTVVVHGKGLLSCATGKLSVWNLGDR